MTQRPFRIQWKESQKTILQIFHILSPTQRLRAFRVAGFILINSVLEVFTLASTLPFILLLFQNQLIHSNPYLKTIYHSFSFTQDSHFLLAVLLGLFLLFIAKNILNGIMIHQQLSFIYDLTTDFSKYQFQRFFKQDLLSVKQTNSSYWTRMIYNRPIEFSIQYLNSWLVVVSEGLIFLFITSMILIYDWRIIGLFILILTPPLVLLFFLKKKFFRPQGDLLNARTTHQLQIILQGIQGYVEMKLYQTDYLYIQKFITFLNKLNRQWALLNTLKALPSKFSDLLILSGAIVIYVYSLFFQNNFESILYFIGIFAISLYRLTPSLNRLSVAWMDIQTYQYTLETFEPPQEKKKTSEKEPLRKKIKFQKTIRFENIGFTYPKSSFFLEEINFTIKKGELIGLTGPSGSGKTTLTHIFLHLITETSGQIFLDEKNRNNFHPLDWQKLFGYVSQDPHMIEGSILENILFFESFDDQRDAKRLDHILYQAGLSDFIKSLPKGIHTLIGEQGKLVSEGQKQRICIARALYRDTPILIFDEATNAIDLETEEHILQMITQVKKERIKTILMIGHQMSALKYCDHILQLDGGKLMNVKENSYSS